ncbi:MAG: PadR family transcriptional regulator [Gemmatimonadetes bacterium]|nr:PadR family transcriptional regulator [Gemmatimonadota bacterium]MDA1103545.1 PadR family transcriptional regulator [Gemmatimonadota bacterium]
MGKGSHLGDLEELILLTVLRLGEDAHGGRVRDELKELAGRSVSVSTVYVTLMRLEEKGYARSWKGEPTSERGGKAKRHYEVSPEGAEVLEAVRRVRDRIWQGIEAISTEAAGA